jgi:hypothetical protein
MITSITTKNCRELFPYENVQGFKLFRTISGFTENALQGAFEEEAMFPNILKLAMQSPLDSEKQSPDMFSEL